MGCVFVTVGINGKNKEAVFKQTSKAGAEDFVFMAKYCVSKGIKHGVLFENANGSFYPYTLDHLIDAVKSEYGVTIRVKP